MFAGKIKKLQRIIGQYVRLFVFVSLLLLTVFSFYELLLGEISQRPLWAGTIVAACTLLHKFSGPVTKNKK
jgi:hypothetical protein